mgnify:CR=1 FL=1
MTENTHAGRLTRPRLGPTAVGKGTVEAKLRAGPPRSVGVRLRHHTRSAPGRG